MKTENHRVLIIDDERPVLMTLEALLKRHGYHVDAAATASQGLKLLKSNSPSLVLLDLQLPDAHGLEMLDRIKTELPEVQVIILTAHDSLHNAIESIKRGAYHFISKPYAPEELLSLVEKALEKQFLLREAEKLREKTEQLEKRLEIAEARPAPIFKSKPMQEIEELIEAMAPSDANVLIAGESGVGKEVIANTIHARSRRAGQPMVKLNCAAFPQTMIEGELFGYVKGAFTGAMHDFPGMIAAADGGTLFLDEISDMPADLQTRFLRVLQEREYRPLGSTQTMKATFRAIAATNRPIPEALAENRLRSDLYYRLNTFQIEVPPLRKRKEDIPPLDRAIRETIFSTTRQTGAGRFTGCISEAARLFVAGKCSRTAKRHRIRRGAGAAGRDRRKRVARRNTVASGVATNRTWRIAAQRRANSRRRGAERHSPGACRMPRQQEKSSRTARHSASHPLQQAETLRDRVVGCGEESTAFQRVAPFIDRDRCNAQWVFRAPRSRRGRGIDDSNFFQNHSAMFSIVGFSKPSMSLRYAWSRIFRSGFIAALIFA